MKRSLCSSPEPFSLLPLLTLLPVQGKVGRLESLTASLFARYEKVVAQQREKPEGKEPLDREMQRRFSAEEAMLKQVLDWLAVRPERQR